jgi:hypothetical protein
VRVTLVAETFTPAVNGVVNSVIRVADQLAERGHHPVVLAPSGRSYDSASGHRIEVVRVPSVPLPGYRGLSVARPGVCLAPILRDLDPDVVHLASPAVLGRAAGRAARELRRRPHRGAADRPAGRALRRRHRGSRQRGRPGSGRPDRAAAQCFLSARARPARCLLRRPGSATGGVGRLVRYPRFTCAAIALM